MTGQSAKADMLVTGSQSEFVIKRSRDQMAVLYLIKREFFSFHKLKIFIIGVLKLVILYRQNSVHSFIFSSGIT